jgi:hypothetical protein
LLHPFVKNTTENEGDGDLTKVFVLDVPARLPLQLGHVLGLGGKVLDEHLLVGSISDALRRRNTVRLAAARVMTKAALLEQMVMSGSTPMIFLTLVTRRELVTAG